MGFATGDFRVSKLPSGVKHTAEALVYVISPFSQEETRQVVRDPRGSANHRTPRPITEGMATATYNTSCNLYM